MKASVIIIIVIIIIVIIVIIIIIIIIIIVSEALFYACCDTPFQGPFLGCGYTFGLVSRLLFFSLFSSGFLFAGVRKTQEDTLKVFILSKIFRHAK